MVATHEPRYPGTRLRSFEMRIDLTRGEFAASATDAALHVAHVLRQTAGMIEEGDLNVGPIRTIDGEIVGQFEFAEVPLSPLEANARLVLKTLKAAIDMLAEGKPGTQESRRAFVVYARDVAARAEGRSGPLSLSRWLLDHT